MAVQACRTCNEAGRICDGKKPVCEACSRHLEELCTWTVTPHGQRLPSPLASNQRSEADGSARGFQSVCSASPIRYQIPLQYCMTDGVGEDRAIQYMVFHAQRQGLLPGPPSERQIDPLDMVQKAMASAASVHALLALAAAICPSEGPDASKLAVHHYGQAMREIRRRVGGEGFGQGVVSAIGLLHFYELHKIDEPLPSRAHLSGLSQVLHNELQSRPQAITNLVPALQRFVYHTATNALFDPTMVGSTVSFDTIEDWGRYISARPGADALGILCVSVPLALLACVYRLSLLNSHPDTLTWVRQLEVVKRILTNWNTTHSMWQASGSTGNALIGRLYYSACCILFQALTECRRMPPAYEIQQILSEASNDLQFLSNLQFPYHVTAWPLLIHGFAASDASHASTILMALRKMDMNAHITSAKHTVKLLETVWYSNMGLNVLSRPDLLSPILL